VDNDGQTLDEWSIYKSIHCETELNGKTYVLSTGKWYRVDVDFVEGVNQFVAEIPRYAGELPSYRDAAEEAYCARAAAEAPARFALMDQKVIPIGGRYGKIEFCDLMTPGKALIHVKRYGASGVLSHLFSQAVVSAEAFRGEPAFREGALARLPAEYRLFEVQRAPQAAEYEVVFAIVSDREGELTLPFFSRVNIRQATKRLRTFGYRVSFTKIQVADEIARRRFHRLPR
jgi:uncharacterized protein (TIGR04141 family)